MPTTVDDYLQLLDEQGEGALIKGLKPVLVQLVHDDKEVVDVTPWAGHDVDKHTRLGGLAVHILEKKAGDVDPRISIGRSRSADVTVALARLSKVHAWVRFTDDGKIEVIDGGSKNGTQVGQTHLLPSTPATVKDGGLITLGPYPFRVFTPPAFVAWLQRSREEGPTQTGTATGGARLEIVGPLGRGGMADVALARRVGPGGFRKEIALKRLLPEMANDRHFVDMFLQEARIAARLSHPNVVQIFDLGWDGQRYFIAMEYVHGWNLATIQRTARRLQMDIPVAVACRVGIDICAGLNSAHTCVDEAGKALDIVHRDVSPQNVLVTLDGVAKISDFGVSKAADSIRHTRPGELKGKLAYMAPEQMSDNLGPVDKRTDIFAAGLVIYECLYGLPLFRRSNDVETMHALLHEPIPKLSRSDVPQRFIDALLKAMERRSAERTQHISELHAELTALALDIGAGGSSVVAEWLRTISPAVAGEKGLPHVGISASAGGDPAKTEVIEGRSPRRKR